MTRPSSRLDPAVLAAELEAARRDLNALAGRLRADDWIGPYAPTLNPPLWEYGHIVWFQEHWCLRLKPGVDWRASPLLAPLAESRMRWADWLFDSSRIPHAARWRAPLPPIEETRAYGAEVLAAVGERLGGDPTPDERYFAELALHHERMHIEAWWMMWQHRALAPPSLPELPALDDGGVLAFEAGIVTLGSPRNAGFVFDNEKWAHAVPHDAFEIDRRPVTNREFAEFVDAGGYSRPELWSAAGREWLAASGARHPVYWRRERRGWQLRRFDRWISPEREPVIHVSRHEAGAYATWRGRRLATAAEWVRASSHPRFALGRCWEWTATEFGPYPEFSADPYADYSVPWFSGHAELRGAGSWVTSPALARPTYRNFYMPERRDPFVGFRTARAR